MDGWTDLSRRIRAKIAALPPEDMHPAAMLAAYEESDFEKMEEIRARVDEVVADRDTASKLKAWYRQLCKRPCFHDEYLQAFNEPRTRLVDTDGKGVERITETGVVVAGAGIPGRLHHLRLRLRGRHRIHAPRRLRAHRARRAEAVGAWAEGMRTKHGIHVHGFPNVFFVQPTQGANLISNVPHNLVEAGQTIAPIVRHALDNGAPKWR